MKLKGKKIKKQKKRQNQLTDQTTNQTNQTKKNPQNQTHTSVTGEVVPRRYKGQKGCFWKPPAGFGLSHGILCWNTQTVVSVTASGKVSQQMQCWEPVRRQSMGERRGKAKVNGKNMMLLVQGHPRHIPDPINNTITCLHVPGQSTNKGLCHTALYD